MKNGRVHAAIVIGFAYILASVSERIYRGSDPGGATKFFSWYFVAMAPSVLLAVFAILLISMGADKELVQGAFAVIILLLLFVVTARTDRIYDSNEAEIAELARELREDINLGPWRARAWYFGLFIGSLALAGLIFAVLMRLNPAPVA